MTRDLKGRLSTRLQEFSGVGRLFEEMEWCEMTRLLCELAKNPERAKLANSIRTRVLTPRVTTGRALVVDKLIEYSAGEELLDRCRQILTESCHIHPVLFKLVQMQLGLVPNRHDGAMGVIRLI